MRCMKYVIIPALLAFIAGCLPTSVHPLYTSDDVVFNSDLMGYWYDPDEPRGDVWSFKRWGPDTYRLMVYKNHNISQKPAAEFNVHMCKIGDETYLDFFPREPEDMDEFYNLHLVPTHTFHRIKLEGDSLWIGLFDIDWLNRNLEDGIVNLEHEKRDDMIVLTASTGALQEFVRKYARDAFPIDEEFRLIRRGK